MSVGYDLATVDGPLRDRLIWFSHTVSNWP